MMKQTVTTSLPTTRVFPRTLQEAFPKDYLNVGVFEGPYRDPHVSDLATLLAIIAVVSMAVLIWEYV